MKDFNNFGKLLASSLKNGSLSLLAKSGSEELNTSRYGADNITMCKVVLYDESTEKLSENALYRSNKGLFIKKQGKRYYLKDFVSPVKGKVLNMIQKCLHEHFYMEQRHDREDLEIILNFNTYNEMIHEVCSERTFNYHGSRGEGMFVGLELFGVKVFYSHTTYDPIQIVKKFNR